MYWATGQATLLHVPYTIHALSPSPDTRFCLLTLTPPDTPDATPDLPDATPDSNDSRHGTKYDSLGLCLVTPFTLLARIPLPHAHTQHADMSVTWHTHSRHFILAFDSTLLLFQLRSRSPDRLLVPAPASITFLTGPGQAAHIPHIYCSLLTTCHIQDGLDSLCSLSSDTLLLLTRSGSALTLDWRTLNTTPITTPISTATATVSSTPARLEDLVQGVQARQTTVEHISYCAPLDLLCFHLADHSLFFSFPILTSSSPPTTTASTSTSSIPIREYKSVHFEVRYKRDQFHPTCIAFNPRFRLIAIGTLQSHVLVYTLTQDHRLKHSHTLSPSTLTPPPSHPPSSSPSSNPSSTPVGSVTSMAWTPDGYALAVGWHAAGYALWSVYGHLLVDCLDSEVGVVSRELKRNERYLAGVEKLWWASDGYDLFILPRAHSNSVNGHAHVNGDLDGDGGGGAVNGVYRVPFAKSACTTSSWHANATTPHPILLSSDRLFLYAGMDLSSLSSSTSASSSAPTTTQAYPMLNPVVWNQIAFPVGYVSENAPVTRAVLRSDGRQLVVAGRHGFALAHLSTSSSTSPYTHPASHSSRSSGSSMGGGSGPGSGTGAVVLGGWGMGKWKMFGNQVHERSFGVDGLGWFRDYVLVGCHLKSLSASADGVLLGDDLDPHHSDRHASAGGAGVTGSDAAGFELRVYATRGNLDASALVWSTQLDERVVIIQVTESSLNPGDGDILVALQSGRVLRYRVTSTSSSSSSSSSSLGRVKSVQLVSEWDLSPVLKCGAGGVDSVQYLDWFQPHPSSSDLDTAPFILLRQGRLSLVQQHQQQDGTDAMEWSELVLAKKVEWVQVMAYRRSLGGLFNAVWAFDATRVLVWTNLLLAKREGEFEWVHEPGRDPLDLRLDYYPLSVLVHRGIIAGVEQLISTKHTEGLHYRSYAKTSLFIHYVIRDLLSRRLLKEALALGAYYKSHEYFGHSMEILLHQVLEVESESLIGFKETALLPLVVTYLRNFDQFYEVIVRCARKTEVAMWDYLFSVVGDPKDLFVHCLEAGQLRTATSYLIILQTLEPYSVSSKLQVELLERTLEVEDFELCSEIVRYLTSVNSRKVMNTMSTSPSSSVKSPTSDNTSGEGELMQSRSGLIALSAEEEQTFYIDILISRHARKLMQRRRIRALAKLAAALNFPLVEWMFKERNRSMMVKDLKQVLKELHSQFEWPYPSSNASNNSSNGGADGGATASSGGVGGMVDGMKKQPQTTTGVLRRFSFGSEVDVHLSRSPSNEEIPGGFNGSPDGRRSSAQASDDQLDASNVTAVYRKRAVSHTPAHMMPRRNSLRTDLESEIRNLVSQTRQARCYAWCVLLSTLLMDVSVIADVLYESKSAKEPLFDAYVDAVRATGCLEYMSLVNMVSEIHSLQ